MLVVPDNYSPRKIRLLEAYGAEVRLADSRRGRDTHFVLARELLRQNPGWFMPDQLVNAVNVEFAPPQPPRPPALGNCGSSPLLRRAWITTV
ncbi:hypothetical protein PHAMO_220088 [Magnetospirillum molischianum DSM 120]|uniref:Tryptophan synthase beta chain-like PALP domain-containing protein n=1 Tax=Magnetospirillum molischianum DSM 120 TaxID=1150626 RepID=H8FRI2_MAGML|nr:hypothetical protein PHAMO_220088 [Magnetospirillum molischianum DSM 120]